MTRESLMRMIERADSLEALKAAVSETRKKVRASKRAASSRRKDRTPRAPGESKAAKREERNARTAEVRAECVKRADGKCELCGKDGGDAEMHHLLPGQGRRTQEQAVSNCIMVCSFCHAVFHRRILYAGPLLLEWAAKHGYAEAAANVRRRMDKALLADPTWPRDEDETRRLGPAAPTQTGETP